MITALQRMKEPLLYLKKHNSDFEKLVPTEDEPCVKADVGPSSAADIGPPSFLSVRIDVGPTSASRPNYRDA